MITVNELKTVQHQLARALKEAEAADKAYATADKRYQTEVQAKLDAYRQQLETEHSDIVKARDAAYTQSANASFTVKIMRDEAKITLDSFTRTNDDKSPLPGFSRRDSIDFTLYGTEYDFVKSAVDAGMLFLLKPDEGAIKTLVKAYAIPNDSQYLKLPPAIDAALPTLEAMNKRQWTISDKALLKLDIPEPDADETQEIVSTDDTSNSGPSDNLNELPF